MRRRLCAVALSLLAWCMLSAHSCCGGALLNVLSCIPSGGFGGGGTSVPSLHEEEGPFRDIGVILEKVDRHGYHTLTEEERLVLIRYRARR